MPTNLSASFRRFHRKRAAAGLQPAATFSRQELALIESLERQRHRTGRVRAVIDDPAQKFEQVLLAYIVYIQHLDRRDALIVEQAISLRQNPRQNPRPGAELQRSLRVTARSYLRILCPRHPIGQVLLLNSEKYCPGLPLCRSRLDQILQLAIPYACGPNSVLIIHGSSHTTKNTRFRHWLAIASSPESIYLTYGAEATSLRCAKRKPRSPRRPLIVRWRPSHGRIKRLLTPRAPIIPISQFLIPNSKAFAA